jgi:hypothetical protein
MLSEAKLYRAYARKCLQMAENADSEEGRRRLIELSRAWLEEALREESVVNVDVLAEHP